MMSSSSTSTRSPSKSSLSPELSERLKPDHRHNRDHHDFHRRRHQRRPNKRGRRQWHHNSSRPRSPIENNPRASRPRSPRSRSPEQPQTSKVEKRSPVKNASSSGSSGSGSKDNLHRRGIKKNLVLRPTKGPLLNAPKNSTQFIIDDHEPFLDTEVSPKKYNTRSRSVSSSSRRVSASEEAFCSPSGSPEKTVTSSTTAAASNEKASANAGSAAEKSSKEEKDCQATPGNYVVGDDDYTYWAEYSDRDFQSVYESAHQEEVADWDRQRLIDEISNLEKRQKELVSVLAKVDPEMYAQRLESQLATLQEKNRLLKDEMHIDPAPPVQAVNQALSSHDDESSMDSTTTKSAPQESPDSSTK